MKNRFVQTINPKSKWWVLIDRKLAKIIGIKKEPYKNVLILK
jgi:hypothetical protein